MYLPATSGAGALVVFALVFAVFAESALGADVEVELVVDLHPRTRPINKAKARGLLCRDRLFIMILQVDY